jgi:hypothetical protein
MKWKENNEERGNRRKRKRMRRKKKEREHKAEEKKRRDGTYDGTGPRHQLSGTSPSVRRATQYSRRPPAPPRRQAVAAIDSA